MSARGVTETVAKIRSRVENTWAVTIAAEVRPPVAKDGEEPTAPAWPHRFPVGRADSAELSGDFGAHVRQLREWRDWARDNNVGLEEATRMVSGTRQEAVTHVVVNDIDTAAGIAGGPWPAHIATARARATVLHARFPDQSDLPRAVRGAVSLDDVDIDILCRVCDWFLQRSRDTGTSGRPLPPRTPRQVPIEGVHAKWLHSHRGLVRTVTGLDDLGLLPPHPGRFHFTYLDPQHLATGGRRHDSHTVGDTIELPYSPRIVIISENKDTAIGFPPVAGGVAIEGEGRGAGTIASAPWVRAAPSVVYWGDMDQDGLEILNEFRAAGLAAGSILMDVDTYERYQQYGTSLDRHQKPVRIHPARDVPHLRDGELALYELLSSGTAPLPRVEQERIPLDIAVERLGEPTDQYLGLVDATWLDRDDLAESLDHARRGEGTVRIPKAE